MRSFLERPAFLEQNNTENDGWENNKIGNQSNYNLENTELANDKFRNRKEFLHPQSQFSVIQAGTMHR